MLLFRSLRIPILLLFFSFLLFSPAFSAVPTPRYDTGSPTLKTIWIDPVRGNDTQDGLTRARALRTISAAWNLIPETGPLTQTGYQLMLVRGTYDASTLPTEGILFGKQGTKQYPIIIQGADGAQTAIITRPLNIQNNSHLALIDLDIRSDAAGGNTVQLANSHHILFRNVRIIGGAATAQAFKGNQIQYVYLENIEVAGGNLGLDFVAAQYGHIVNSVFRDAEEWCLYLKGGTAYFRVEGNEVYGCRSAGAVSLGNSTGFDYMVSPWIHYEAKDIKFVNNIIRDTPGSGLGVFGGYNILVAHNTFSRIATSDIGYGLLTIGYGGRPCVNDEEYARGMCRKNHDAGGWGTTQATEGEQEWIPNKHVFIYNNIFHNPSSTRSRYAHLTIYGPRTAPAGVNLTRVQTDDDLQIRGNIIWNKGDDLELGLGENTGCRPTNTSCNQTQLERDNTINITEPSFTDVGRNDFHPNSTAGVFTSRVYTIPSFTWNDAPLSPATPPGTLENIVSQDKDGRARLALFAGAYTSASSAAQPPAGSLIKLTCPNTPVSVSHPCKTVYYYNSRGQRQVFPHEKVFFSWYPDFSSVINVEATTLASIPLGKNVTYRPGVRLVKFTTVNRVYAVSRGGILRWVTSEEIARQLYGINWNKMVDDISDAFYPDYQFGTDIASSSDFNPTEATRLTTTIDQN